MSHWSFSAHLVAYSWSKTKKRPRRARVRFQPRMVCNPSQVALREDGVRAVAAEGLRGILAHVLVAAALVRPGEGDGGAGILRLSVLPFRYGEAPGHLEDSGRGAYRHQGQGARSGRSSSTGERAVGDHFRAAASAVGTAG